jgi:hypothetical protein
MSVTSRVHFSIIKIAGINIGSKKKEYAINAQTDNNITEPMSFLPIVKFDHISITEIIDSQQQAMPIINK